MPVKLSSTGGGSVTLTTPSTGSDYTLTMPAATGTVNMSGLVNEVPVGSASAPSIYSTGDTNTGVFFPTADTVALTTGGSERARIDSSGNLLVGTTTGAGRATISWNSLSQQGLVLITTSTTFSGSPIVFYNSSASVSGFIGQAAGSVSYNTSSDYRLKHDVQPLVGGLATVAALKPSTYKWNADNSPGEGFIAHELAEVIPLAVSGEKDAINEDGSIKPQGVDYSKIVVHLVAAIQELTTKLEATEARIAALEAK
jgi:hypothetical protein